MREIFICENCSSVLSNEFSICPRCLKEKGMIVHTVNKDVSTSDMSLEEFIKYANPIPQYINNDYTEYLWDDWDKCKELINSNKNIVIYTVIDEDRRCWLVNDYRVANRVGYFFSEVFIEIEEGIEY